MTFGDLVGQGVGAIYSLVTLVLVTVLVARTSRRVLGIRVSTFRALLVSLVVLTAGGSLFPLLVDREHLTEATGANLTALAVLGMGLALGSFAAGLLVLMVLEVVVPSGSVPSLRTLLSGWRARLRRTGRYLQIMWILARHGLIGQLRGVLRAEPGAASAVRQAMEDAGVTFIKLGQMLSTRSDLLPEPFIKEFSKLTSQADPQPYPEVEKVLVAELGSGMARLQIDPEPLASASLAQVHTAILDDDIRVVVKVQRAGAAELALIDLQILDRLARTLARNADWARRLGVVDITRGFTDSVHEELDYRIELANMAALQESLGDTEVRVPTTHNELCTERVLVMERFDGVPVVRAEELIRALPAQTRSSSAQVLLRAILGQILADGVFHADLHAGNVLIWPGGSVGLLDYGSVGRLDAASRRNLALLLWAVDVDDAALATDAVLELLDHDGQIDERSLQRSLGVLITRLRTGGTGGSLSFFQRLVKLVLQHGMTVPRSIALALRSLGALEGTLLLLDPQLDLISTARDLARDVVGDVSPQGAQKQIANQAVRLVPLLEHLPRRLNRITEDLTTGRFSSNLRILADHNDRSFLTSLANQVVVAVLAGFAVVGAIMLVTAPGGPAVYGFRVFDILGFLLGFSGFILALRSVAMVFGRRS